MEPNLNHKFMKTKIYFFPKSIHFPRSFPSPQYAPFESPALDR